MSSDSSPTMQRKPRRKAPIITTSQDSPKKPPSKKHVPPSPGVSANVNISTSSQRVDCQSKPQSHLPLSRKFLPLAFALMMLHHTPNVWHPRPNLQARYPLSRVLLPSLALVPLVLMTIHHKRLLLTLLLPRCQKKHAIVTAAPRKKSQEGNKGFKTNFLISKL